MKFSTLTAISPVDGRYRNKVEGLAAYFSEYALIKYRVQVEIEYFITLAEFLPQLNTLTSSSIKEDLRKIYKEFSLEDASRIKDIESTTNHDVKAVEYFIKEKIDFSVDGRSKLCDFIMQSLCSLQVGVSHILKVN